MIWLLVSGLPLALEHVAMGLLLCVTILGIPFGLQQFKLAKLALLPLGQRWSSCDQTGTEKAVRLPAGVRFHTYSGGGSRTAFYIWQDPAMQKLHGCGHEYVDAWADGKV